MLTFVVLTIIIVLAIIQWNTMSYLRAAREYEALLERLRNYRIKTALDAVFFLSDYDKPTK